MLVCSITITYVCSHPEASCPGTTRQGDRIREPVSPTLTHISYQSHKAQQYIILRRSHCQVTKVPGQAPHITAEYSADIRNRTPRAMVKSTETEASGKHNKLDKRKSLKYLMFTLQYTKGRGRAVAMGMLPSPPTNPNPALTVWF